MKVGSVHIAVDLARARFQEEQFRIDVVSNPTFSLADNQFLFPLVGNGLDQFSL